MERSLTIFLTIFVSAFVVVLVCVIIATWVIFKLRRLRERRQKLLDLSQISRAMQESTVPDRTPSELDRYIDKVTPRGDYSNGPVVIDVNDLPKTDFQTIPKTNEQNFYSSVTQNATSTPRVQAVFLHDATSSNESVPYATDRNASPISASSDSRSGTTSTEPVIETEALDSGVTRQQSKPVEYSSIESRTSFQGPIVIHVDNMRLPDNQSRQW